MGAVGVGTDEGGGGADGGVGGGRWVWEGVGCVAKCGRRSRGGWGMWWKWGGEGCDGEVFAVPLVAVEVCVL